jgi:hypothetical protein
MARGCAALLIAWESRSFKRINKGFRAVVKAAGLGKDVTPHTLRHTAIAWQTKDSSDNSLWVAEPRNVGVGIVEPDGPSLLCWLVVPSTTMRLMMMLRRFLKR